MLIGESDERAGALLEAWYAGYCDNAPPVERMGLVNAELAKLSVNTYVTMKIAFANTLARGLLRGPRGDRTHNPRIKSPLLCQLS